jgi:hypothetical protein
MAQAVFDSALAVAFDAFAGVADSAGSRSTIQRHQSQAAIRSPNEPKLDQDFPPYQLVALKTFARQQQRRWCQGLEFGRERAGLGVG